MISFTGGLHAKPARTLRFFIYSMNLQLNIFVIIATTTTTTTTTKLLSPKQVGVG